MLPIISRRSFFHFYLAILGLTIFNALMATFTIGLHSQAINKVGEMMLLAMGVAFILAGLYMPYKFIKNVPRIMVNRDHVSFNRRTYNWSDIENISLTGKIPFKNIIAQQIEGMTFKFKDGSVEYAFDKMYSNSWEIKQFIERIIIGKKESTEMSDTLLSGNTEFEVFEYYGGVIGVQGAMSIMFILFIAGVVLFNQKNHETSVYISVSVLCLIVLFFTTFLWYYFGVSSNYLIVRNRGFFWVRTLYPLAEIKEVVIESKSKRPNGLRIITREFKTKLYYAELLTDKKWRQLKADLESKNIKVRVETYIGEG